MCLFHCLHFFFFFTLLSFLLLFLRSWIYLHPLSSRGALFSLSVLPKATVANRFLPETCHNCYLNVSTILTKYLEVHDIEAVTRSSVTLTKPSSWLGSQSRVVSFHSAYLALKSLPSHFASLDTKNGKGWEIQVLVLHGSHLFLLMLLIFFLWRTPFSSPVLAYNSLFPVMLRMALKFIPFCFQGPVVAAATESPPDSSLLTFACLGYPACLSSNRKWHFLQIWNFLGNQISLAAKSKMLPNIYFLCLRLITQSDCFNF